MAFLVGVDEINAVFVAPRIWKKNDQEVYWPPKTCRNVGKLAEESHVPAINWQISKCKWMDFASGEYIINIFLIVLNSYLFQFYSR